MRKITEEAIDAFENGRRFKKANTEVYVDLETTKLILHGNTIAVKDYRGLLVRTAGWNSNTTRDRLNGIPGVHVTSRNGVLRLNAEQWDGSWKHIFKY